MAIPSIPDWRERILAGVGVKPTPQNLTFMSAWARAEGGGATNNPFNTTQPSGNASKYNSVGVRNYGDAQQGIEATVNTLTNGRYGNIIGALREGDSAVKSAAALAASPWGTGALVQKILGGGGSVEPQPAPAAGASTEQPAYGAPTVQLPDFGSATVDRNKASALQPSPMEALRARTGQILDQAMISPNAVALMANLGSATKAVTKSRTDPDSSMLGYDPENMPVAKTLTTLQSGSSDSRFKTLDLATDFDGPVHPNANPVVNMAQQFLGTPYLWGGADPRKGFDCSGFVQYIYAQAGVAVGRTTYAQVKQGQAVREVENLQPGDAVFFADRGDVHHEGLYIGGGQFIHAPHTGDVVKISSLSEPYYASQFVGGRRFIAPGDAPKA
jgi:cell wall-associated NlpC family hydrolase